MLTATRVRELLEPFGLALTASQLSQLRTYLDLLVRWNQKINLTAIRTPEECVTRHFGESLYLARWAELEGTLLDIGSGAGFPGLALKIVFPQLSTTLLEPVAKKRAFLKEAARACAMESVEVRAERWEDFIRQNPSRAFDNSTVRAVGRLARLVPDVARCLKPRGRLFLWLTREQAGGLPQNQRLIDWGSPIPLPLSRQREIWVGSRSQIASSG